MIGWAARRGAEVLAPVRPLRSGIAAIHGLEGAGGVEALRDRARRGTTPCSTHRAGCQSLTKRLPVAKQIADAPEAAHEKGILRRDLKPANIRVRPDGTVKVLDLGLAKAVALRPARRRVSWIHQRSRRPP